MAALSPGTQLGAYEILEPIGKGGMGEVYRGRDTKLGREVAIKILPAEVVDDEERLGRFRREAQVLASLNHPHIGAIHGLEEDGGRPFLVLELVDGETLGERMIRGAIAVEDAVALARQVAEALEQAHAKGIVHRDLKPASSSGLSQIEVGTPTRPKSWRYPAIRSASTRVLFEIGGVAGLGRELRHPGRVAERIDRAVIDVVSAGLGRINELVGVHAPVSGRFFQKRIEKRRGLESFEQLVVSQAQRRLVLTMNCLNGYFHVPYFDSLAESLVKQPGKGAIAAFSPSGLSLNGPAHRYHQTLLEQLVGARHRRLGDPALILK